MMASIAIASKLGKLQDLKDLDAVRANAILAEDRNVRQGLKWYISKLRNVAALLTGDDLLAMGVVQGTEVGEVLGRLLDARLDGLVKTVGDEREMVRRWISNERSVGKRS